MLSVFCIVGNVSLFLKNVRPIRDVACQQCKMMIIACIENRESVEWLCGATCKLVTSFW